MTCRTYPAVVAWQDAWKVRNGAPPLPAVLIRDWSMRVEAQFPLRHPSFPWRPVGGESALGAVHLVASMLSELHPEAIARQSQRLNAGLDERLGEFGALSRWPTGPDITHELCCGLGLAIAAAPHAAFIHLTEGNGNHVRRGLQETRVDFA